MIIKPSTLLRNDYGKVSNMVRETAEPVYITLNGEGDTVIMSIDAFEAREQRLRHRAEILEAELNRLTGTKSYTTEEVRAHLKEKYFKETYDVMKRLLIVVDMQNDFVTGSLGSKRAESILPNVQAKIEEYRKRGDEIIFTRDTHHDNYLETQEGRLLPVVHCVEETDGHRIVDGLETDGCQVLNKPSFGSVELAEEAAAGDYDEIELCGLCTDICVVSNALILKAEMPETKIVVDASCCAGVTEEGHNAALMTMKSCQVSII